MPKLIFKCRHMRTGNTAHRSTYVRYIATRDGVEMPRVMQSQNPATQKQIALIDTILSAYPDTAELFEYEDYTSSPTVTNASNFIARALEDNYADAIGRKQYVSYLATRPGVAALDEHRGHGLFGAEDTVPSLAKVVEDVAQHTGTVWTPILSLRREDASRLGFDNPERWQQLIRAKALQIAGGLKIPAGDFVWYAAYHDEDSHPHVHMVCWSKDPSKGFLTKQGIRFIKSELVNDIFRDELHQLYARQTQYRNAVQTDSEEKLREAVERMSAGTDGSAHIAALLEQLAERLHHHSGKMQYGYLRPPVKAIVNQIVDALAAEPLVADAYKHWCDARREILLGYSDKPAYIPPLSQNEVFKPVRNMVVRHAVELMKAMDRSTPNYVSPATRATDRTAPIEHIDHDTDSAVLDSAVAMIAHQNVDETRTPSSITAAIRLMHSLASIFQQCPPYHKVSVAQHIDRKRRRELRQKTGGKSLMPDEHQNLAGPV